VLKLAQGEINITLKVWDYSRKGEGNPAGFQHKSIVDTVPLAFGPSAACTM